MAFPAPILMKTKLISSTMWISYILNFTKISQEMWKVLVEVHLCSYVKYTTTELIFNTVTFARQPFAKDSYTEFDENPSDGEMDHFNISVFSCLLNKE
jgi:hypothetical protein